MTLEVEPLALKDEHLYQAFLSRHQNALFYYSLQYRDFLIHLTSGKPHYLVAKEKGDICGILPLMEKEGPFGKIINSLPFFGSNGSVLAESDDAKNALWRAYCQIINEKSVAASTLISNPFEIQNAPPIPYDHTDYRIGQITSLNFTDHPEEALMAQIDSSTRRNIRKAYKEGVKVRRDYNRLDVLKTLHLENIKSIGGKTKPNVFFDDLSKFFVAEEMYDLFVAECDGKIISALLLFYFGETVEYFIPGTDPLFRNKQPSAAIIKNAMLYAHKKGLKHWNWGGTWETQEGVMAFKRKWAAIDKKYSYYTSVKNKAIYDSTPQQLLCDYKHFYVLPFNALHSSTGE